MTAGQIAPKRETPILVLEPFEILMATRVGMQRHGASVHRAEQHGHDSKRSEADHVLGAMCEVVVCKYLNIYFDGSVNTFHKPDAINHDGTPLQVRGTKGTRLVFRKSDNPEEVFIAVSRLDQNSFIVQGWMKGMECMAAGLYEDPHERGAPAWFVSFDKLHAIPVLRGGW